MKKYLLWFPACIALLAGCTVSPDATDDSSLEFPDSRESIWLGEVAQKPYAVFLANISPTSSDFSDKSRRSARTKEELKCLEGHFLDLSQATSDTIAFRVILDGRWVQWQPATGPDKTFKLAGNSHMGKKQTDICIKQGGLKKDIRLKFRLLERSAFRTYDSNRYAQGERYPVKVVSDREYAQAEGYWSQTLDEESGTVDLLRKLGQVKEMQTLPLEMDLYLPQKDTLSRRPLLLFFHGGAFFYGSKTNAPVVKWCEYLASTGYVVASANYRIGFKLGLTGIERTAYSAAQDANAALRYLVSRQDEFRIDTSMIFVGGCSAGGITALHLAFMTEQYRPVTSYAVDDLPDLGPLTTNGNQIREDFSIKAAVDMWGAVSDINMIDSHAIPVIAFHGNADNIVPYGYDYPFQVAGFFKKSLFNKMYGSQCVVERARQNGYKAELHTFDGWKHSPHLTNDTINQNFYYIQDNMVRFLREVMVPEWPSIQAVTGSNVLVNASGQATDGPAVYRLESCLPIVRVNWKAEGGLLLSQEDGQAKVVWISNAPSHRLKASGTLPYGIGFTAVGKP